LVSRETARLRTCGVAENVREYALRPRDIDCAFAASSASRSRARRSSAACDIDVDRAPIGSPFSAVPATTFQMRTWLSAPALKIRAPVSSTHTAHTLAVWPDRTKRQCRSPSSYVASSSAGMRQTRTSPSLPPVTSIFPSGVTLAHSTGPTWPRKRRMGPSGASCTSTSCARRLRAASFKPAMRTLRHP
jgi:hypothetical protein